MKKYQKVFLICCIFISFYFSVFPILLLFMYAFFSSLFSSIFKNLIIYYFYTINFFTILLLGISDISLYFFYKKTKDRINLNNVIMIFLLFGILFEAVYILGFISIGVLRF